MRQLPGSGTRFLWLAAASTASGSAGEASDVSASRAGEEDPIDVPRPKAIIRADADRARGDLGSAKRRLTSLLVSNGYDPVIVGQVGRLCLEMGDRAEAGRYLILSDETGDDVEASIATFVRLHRRDPLQIWRQFPRFARGTFDRFPEPVRQRLHALGIEEAARTEAAELARRQRGARVMVFGCLAVGTLLLGLLVLGIVTVMSGLFS